MVRWASIPPVVSAVEARTCNDNELVSKLADFAINLVGIRLREVLYHKGMAWLFPGNLEPCE